jgi:formylglycine-generating enzyme required for sulfatase activity
VGTLTDYRGAASGTSRYVKDCDWNSEALSCTVQYHSGVHPHRRDSNTTGFRVVKN